MGQPFATATAGAAAAAEPTLDQVVGAQPQFSAANPSPVPTIQELQSQSQPPSPTPSALQMDFKDPTNLFAPTSGPVAEKYRLLQQQYAGDLTDEPPLTPLQILGLTMSAIANPQAVQEVLRARRQRASSKAKERRVMNMRLLDVASRLVAADSEMKINMLNLERSQRELDLRVAADARDQARQAPELARLAADTERMNLQNQRLRDVGRGEFGGGTPAGMISKGVSTDNEGNVTRTYGPEPTGNELFNDALKMVSKKDQFGMMLRPDADTYNDAFRLVLSQPNLPPSVRAEIEKRRDTLLSADIAGSGAEAGVPFGPAEPPLSALAAPPPGAPAPPPGFEWQRQ